MIGSIITFFACMVWLPYRIVMGVLKFCVCICFEIFFWMWIALLFGKRKRRW